MDPDRQQRARLSEAGAAVVAEHRRCVVRCEDAASRDGLARRRAGLRHGASGEVRRAGRLRSEAAQEGDGRVLVRQGPEGRHHRAAAQARQREAEGRDGRLRHADQVVAGTAPEARGSEVSVDVNITTKGRERSRPFSVLLSWHSSLHCHRERSEAIQYFHGRSVELQPRRTGCPPCGA